MAAIPEDLPAYLQDAMRQIVRPTVFYLADGRQQFRGLDLVNGSCADGGEDVALQSPVYIARVRGNPGMGLVSIPLASHGLEGIGRCGLLGFASLPSVPLPGLALPLIAYGQRHACLWRLSGSLVDTRQGQPAFPCPPAGISTASIFAVRENPQIKTVAVMQLTDAGPFGACGVLHMPYSSTCLLPCGISGVQKTDTTVLYHLQKPDAIGHYCTALDAILA